jgi:hypothetical protein
MHNATAVNVTVITAFLLGMSSGFQNQSLDWL